MSAPVPPPPADPDLIPGRVEQDKYGWPCYVPTPTMSRGDAIRAIIGAVEMEHEPQVEEALFALGVNPAELFFAVCAGGVL